VSPERKLWLARGSCFLQVGCLGQLFVYEAVHMMEQGISGTTVGILLALGSALFIVASPFWGWFADRFHIYRRLIAFGTIGMSGTLFLFARADSIAEFAVYVVLRGFLVSSIMGVMPALVLHNLPQDSQGKGFGSYRSFGSIGFMAATMVLPVFLPTVGGISVLAAILLPLSLIFVFGLDQPERRDEPKASDKKRRLSPILYWFLAATFLIGLTEPAINGFYNSFGRSLGAPLEWIGFISGLNGFIGFICLPLLGRWIDSRGAQIFLVLGYLAQCLRLLTASLIVAPEWLWIPNLFHSFGWAGREVATMVFISMIVPREKRATAISLSISVKMGGMMVGAFLMGRLSDLYGYPVMFRIVACMAVFSLVFLFYVFHLQKKQG